MLINDQLLNFYRSEPDYFDLMKKHDNAQYYQPILNLLRKYRIEFKGKKVLDVGSGTGIFLKILKKEFGKKIDRTGLDVSLIGKKYYKGIKFVEGEATKLPFRNNLFDIVFSIDVLEHLVNPQKAFEELYRVTKINGYILVRTRNFRSPLMIRPLISKKTLSKIFFTKRDSLSLVEKLNPDLSRERLGGDSDAVSEICINHLRNSCSMLKGNLLCAKTWTKGGFWEILNKICFLDNLGTMSLILFNKK